MKNFFLFFIFFVMLFSGCVSQDRVTFIENRIAALEMENTREAKKEKKQEQSLEELETNTEKIASLSREHYASLQAELQSVKMDMRRIKGVVEEAQYKFNNLSNRGDKAEEKKLEQLSRKVDRNLDRIVALEKYMGFEPSLSSEQKEDDSVTDSTELKKDPKLLYENAKKMFDEGKMEGARIEFEKFINLFPNSDQADNARFWIADSYYKENWYEKAILEYQKVIEKYADGNKVPAALLKQGYAFANLGEKANARLILKELVKKYPESKESKIARQKLESLN